MLIKAELGRRWCHEINLFPTNVLRIISDQHTTCQKRENRIDRSPIKFHNKIPNFSKNEKKKEVESKEAEPMNDSP